ncbi:ABC transporter permease [Clostridium sp. AL.422]|uniref:ABC transporter permease n=1 Tax=Clostridium TaxID=1485 RepID=UPI00293DFBE2|nr:MULTISPECIES: ABC transporter permease [unclassified Clostridium]MDV4152738.1 ABC transporter permease [Clostridium sp. AL.422]
MKLLYYTKITLKGMLSNAAVTIAFFILFPVLLAGFMGFMQNSLHENPLKLNILKISIADNDNSNMSKNLVSFLGSNDMRELVEVNDKESDVEIVIPKGYEESVVSLEKNEIKINKLEEGYTNSTNTLKTILDKYHQGLYVSLSGGSTEALNNITGKSVIENINITTGKTSTSYEVLSSSMIGFVISMLIFSFIQGNYTEASINMDRRIFSTPISRTKYFYYSSFALLIYSVIIVSAYVFFFRIAGISFTGSLLPLIALILVSAILIVSIIKCVYELFGANYGKVIGGLVFALPILGMEAFTGEGNALKVLAPTHYITKLFNVYNLNGNFNSNIKDLIFIVILSVVLFGIANIKVSLSKEGRKCA